MLQVKGQNQHFQYFQSHSGNLNVVASSINTYFHILGIGLQQFPDHQHTEISVLISLMNLKVYRLKCYNLIANIHVMTARHSPISTACKSGEV